VSSGVPPGSVLGPVLFLIYINDIVDLFDGSDVRVKLYADDIKIYLEITIDTDCATLQTFIDKITAWSHCWQLKLANNKCQHSRIGLSRAICPADYCATNVKLPTVHNVRDLGVLVDSHLTFHDHINSIVFREHLRSMQIWRCFYAKMLVSYVKLLQHMSDRYAHKPARICTAAFH